MSIQQKANGSRQDVESGKYISDSNERTPLLEEARNRGAESQSSSKFEVDKEVIGQLIEDYEDNSRPEYKDEFHKQKGGVRGLAELIKTDLHDGINTTDVTIKDRQDAFGVNKLKEVKTKTFLQLFLEKLEDPVLIVLIAAAALSTIMGLVIKEEREQNKWIDGVAIWIAVALVSLVGSVNDYLKDQQFRKLNSEKDIFDIKVIRNGKNEIIKSPDLVVGDIYVLDTGDKIVADGFVVKSNNLVIDESSLTGETQPLKKGPYEDDKDPFVKAGTQVTEGDGRVLVVAIGPNTEYGRLFESLQVEQDQTPLQEKLEGVVAFVGKIGFFVAIFCFVSLMIRWIIDVVHLPYEIILSKIVDGPIKFFLTAITIVVVAIPEGLPLAVTISLAYSMRKMMFDQNFVRVLSACETMGGATTICSDKTGTLTENRMTVVEGWFTGKVYKNVVPKKQDIEPQLLEQLALNICLNSKAQVIYDQNNQKPPQFIGNRTECALQVCAKEWGYDYEKIRSEYEQNIAKSWGFSSALKQANVLVSNKSSNGDGKYTLYNKGASEWILNQCDRYVNEESQIVEMTQEARNNLLGIVTEMARRGLRTLTLAHRGYDGSIGEEPPNQNLICVAIVGIKDPVRREVPQAVKACQQAGIKVRMVTGDNLDTAKFIAQECGILTDEKYAIEGPKFRKLEGDELQQVSEEVEVIARSSPQDKFKLVTTLRNGPSRQVVAVTGDGTNDAPALKEADVGLAMGIQGTEVAKEAADIVILDDNFRSIVKSVMWGRCVFNNIQKFLMFQLTVNFVALLIQTVGSIINFEPLNVLQLLWVNLIMDTMAALALATESPTESLLNLQPHGRGQRIITTIMWRHIIVQGIYQVFWIFAIMFGFQKMFARYHVVQNLGEFCQNYDNFAQTPNFDPYRSDIPQYKDFCNQYLTKYHQDVGQMPDNLKSLYDVMMIQLGIAQNVDLIFSQSLLFNTFIFMQVFNEINARKIYDEYTIFEGILKNHIFLGILGITVAFQVLIMKTFFGTYFGVQDLNSYEWLFSILVGVGTIPLSLLTRFIKREILGKSNEMLQAQNKKPSTIRNFCANVLKIKTQVVEEPDDQEV